MSDALKDTEQCIRSKSEAFIAVRTRNYSFFRGSSGPPIGAPEPVPRVPKSRAHEVVDGEVDRGVQYLQKPHNRRDVEEPDGDAEIEQIATVQTLVHSTCLVTERSDKRLKYIALPLEIFSVTNK